MITCACGENHPACIEFHHEDRTQKEYSVSSMVCGGWSIKRILEEISKCTPMCSNCHRKLHYDEDHKDDTLARVG